jgi:hypothetical protein
MASILSRNGASGKRGAVQFEDAVLFTKASIWEYESEWRIVADQHGSGPQIQPFAISGVLFGYRMPEQPRMEVMDILGKQVRYGAAVPDLANYSLCAMDLKNERSYLLNRAGFPGALVT